MAFGARVVGSAVANDHNIRIRRYMHDSGDATALYLGDIVKLATSGTQLTDGEVLPRVIAAAATDVPVGIVVGLDPIIGITIGSENLTRLYLPASTSGVVMVCDDPYVVFEVMADSSATPALADSSKKAKFAVAAGSTSTGMSGTSLSVTNIATTGTLQLQILGFRNSPDNVIGNVSPNPNTIYRAQFAIHQFLPNGAGNNAGV